MSTVSKIVFCLVLTLTFGACRRSSTPTQGPVAYIGNYDEDLSDVRMRYEKKPASSGVSSNEVEEKPSNVTKPDIPRHVNNQIEVALDSMAVRNKNIRYSTGYRIQVYVGNERREVDEAKSFVYQNFPELATYLSFSQPTYRLKAGDFSTRAEAERYYSTIRQRYSAAMIITERIDIRRSIQMR